MSTEQAKGQQGIDKADEKGEDTEIPPTTAGSSRHTFHYSLTAYSMTFHQRTGKYEEPNDHSIIFTVYLCII